MTLIFDTRPFIQSSTIRQRQKDSGRSSILELIQVKDNAAQFAEATADEVASLTLAHPDDLSHVSEKNDQLLGYLVNQDMRPVLRFCNEYDAYRFGTTPIDPKAILTICRRIEDLLFIENAAVAGQMRAVKLAQILAECLNSGTLPPALAVKVGQALHQIQKEDAEAKEGK